MHFNVTVLPISTISIFGSDICIKISGCGSGGGGGGLLVVEVIIILSLSEIRNKIISSLNISKRTTLYSFGRITIKYKNKINLLNKV